MAVLIPTVFGIRNSCLCRSIKFNCEILTATAVCDWQPLPKHKGNPFPDPLIIQIGWRDNLPTNSVAPLPRVGNHLNNVRRRAAAGQCLLTFLSFDFSKTCEAIIVPAAKMPSVLAELVLIFLSCPFYPKESLLSP